MEPRSRRAAAAVGDGVQRALTVHGHDESGNRRQKEDAVGITGYSYDPLYRLTGEDPPGAGSGDTVHYAYDSANNRTFSGAKSGGSWVAPYLQYAYSETAAGLRLESAQDHNGAVVESFPTYDANGNPTSWHRAGGDERTLTWNALGQLIAMGGDYTASYRYGPLGRRIERTEEGVTRRYQYDGLEIIAEYDQTAERALHVFGPALDEPLFTERDGTRAALHRDGFGSVAVVTDGEDSSVLATYEYDAFGGIAASGSFENLFAYTGRERDGSGLYYYRARYYLASVGRFLTPDPTGLADGSNPYVYVASNPVNYVDPYGLGAIADAAGLELSPEGEQFLGLAALIVGAALVPPVASTFWGGLYLRAFVDVLIATDIAAALEGAGLDANAAVWIAVAVIVGPPIARLGAAFLGRALARVGLAFSRASALSRAGALATRGAGRLGDLTAAEVRQIQGVVNQAGRPLEVVGSAARGTRRGVGTDLPIGKGAGTRSDIDFLVPPSSRGHFTGLEKQLPSLDPRSGVIPGTHSPHIGPAVRFEPGADPFFIPGVTP